MSNGRAQYEVAVRSETEGTAAALYELASQVPMLMDDYVSVADDWLVENSNFRIVALFCIPFVATAIAYKLWKVWFPGKIQI